MLEKILSFAADLDSWPLISDGQATPRQKIFIMGLVLCRTGNIHLDISPKLP